MTLIAGAYCLDSRNSVPTDLKKSIRDNICRSNGERGRYDEFETSNFYVVKWDSGAFNEPAWQAAIDSVRLLAGDPLFVDSLHRTSREAQLSRIVGREGAIDPSSLKRCRGNFSVVSYFSSGHRLCMATDMVGLRTIYYLIQDGVFVFSSTLRGIESMIWVTKKLSPKGMLELCAFGFPLAKRTPYDGISVLRECEMLTISDGAISYESYYDWTSKSECLDTPADAAKEIFHEFQEAVRIRLGNDQSVYAFLSGGMDSRAIVSSLAMKGRKIHALNFSPDFSQDQDFAQKFAIATGPGCELHCANRKTDPNFSLLAFEEKTKLEQTAPNDVTRHNFIWSGDGGSVGLGHVYMDGTMIDHLEYGRRDAAVAYFLAFNKIAIPTGILTTEAKKSFSRMTSEGVAAEMDRYSRADLGRRLYLFLLFNDQRRHLFKHFESIDQHGLEFLLPFFDSSFLRKIADTPSRWGILHRLYASWFEHFPGFTRSTPWQTYPGHEPCPVASDNNLSYQWDSGTGKRENLGVRVSVAKRLIELAVHPSTPAMFSRARIVTASVLHGLGLRDYGYMESMLNSCISRSKYT